MKYINVASASVKQGDEVEKNMNQGITLKSCRIMLDDFSNMNRTLTSFST